MKIVNCSALDIPDIVGPGQVFASLGHWNTAVYIILVLHLIPVWVVSGLCLSKLSNGPAMSTLRYLIALPPTLITVTSIGILVPSTGKYIEVICEIVLSFGLVKFIYLCMILCGGHSAITSFCQDRKIGLPIGAPPLVCLLLLQKPKVTRTSLTLVSLMTKMLLGYKFLILIVDLVFLISGYKQSGNFLALDNLHNILSFPVGLLAIYCYTIFNFLMNDCLAGNNKRVVGIILLLEFILFDCLRLFFIFLTGTGMLTCVPPFLSQDLVVHTLKNYIKAFLTTFVGIPYLTICASKSEEMSQSDSTARLDSESSGNEHSNSQCSDCSQCDQCRDTKKPALPVMD